MGGKKRPSSSMEEEANDQTEKAIDATASSTRMSEKIKQMEKRKARKALDKERRRLALEGKQKSESKTESKTEAQNLESELEQVKHESNEQGTSVASTSLAQPGLHLDLFRGLSSQESSVREEAAARLVRELSDVQRSYKEGNRENEDQGDSVKMEAKKDDGMENCAPSLRYAIRRFIRGVSSSREFARQGFALALTAVVGEIHAIKLDSLMMVIVEELEISSGMKGQEAKDNLLGRLFAYGSLARSSRVSEQWKSDKSSSIVKDFVGTVTSLAAKKRYLSEPAVSVILDLANKLPDEAVLNEVLEAPGLKDWFERAANVGDPDALFLALKLQERVNTENDVFGKLLPCPFSADKFFSRDHLLYISPCFKESTFCLPRVHSLWQVVVSLLLPEIPTLEESNPIPRATKKHKKSKKNSSSEDSSTNLSSFCEVVIESSLLFSSHDRKYLALNVLLLTLPKLPASCLQVILSSKVVYCLMDILSNKLSWLYKAGQHFLTEVINYVGENLDRRVTAIVSLQKHSRGKFDIITKTQTVKQLTAKFVNSDGCMYFVQSLASLFVDEGPTSDEPSDESQTTDENSEVLSAEDKDPLTNGNGNGNSSDTLKNWVVDTMPRVIKNLKLNSNLKTLTDEEIVKFTEGKFQVQAEIMKFLTVQGLFTASLGTEVTSFELQEKFKWPKAAISNALRESCIEQLQVLLEEAQKSEGACLLNEIEPNDLASYFARFVQTVSSIPSVSLFTALGNEDDRAFKKLLAMELKLSSEERKVSPGIASSRMHAMRFLLIQLLLQILLHPGEFHEAAIDLTICCKKAFSFLSQGDSSEEEEEGLAPQFMDVLVDTFLSLLPHSSGPLNHAIEQIFRCFCEEVTDVGLIRMLRIVKKELNPRHLAPAGGEGGDDEDEDEDDFLEIEEDDDDARAGGAGLSDESEGIAEPGSVVDGDDEEMEDGMDVDTATNEDDEDEDSEGMDDDAMFRMDAYLAAMFNERRTSGSDSAAQSQFQSFKFRVLCLLEIYLHKNPGKTQVLTVYSFLVQAYVKSHANTGGEQFRQRIAGILQKKIFKAKEYPKIAENQIGTLKTLIEKSLKLVSRSRFKNVATLAQNATFWLLKIVTSMNCPKPELETLVEVFRNTLVDYFNNKKSRLKLGFIKEVVRRYPWVSPPLFGVLIEQCGSTKAEFRRIETLDLLEFIMKSHEKDTSSTSKLVKKHLKVISELIGVLLTNLPQKQSRRADVRRFCTRVLNTVSGLNLNKKFLEGLKPEVCLLCETQLGAAFKPFKAENK